MQHEGWTVVLDDCLNVLHAMPSGSVHVIVTSPPYNIGVNYSQHDDEMPRSAFLACLGECFAELPLCQRSCRPDRIGTSGGADIRKWLDTDKRIKTG